jgi:hypothetical protein
MVNSVHRSEVLGLLHCFRLLLFIALVVLLLTLQLHRIKE